MPTESFDVSGSWVCPDGVTAIDVEGTGSGGHGGASSGGGGGGGGAWAEKLLIAVSPGNSYAYTAGAGNDAEFFETAGLGGAVLMRAKKGTDGQNAGSGSAGGAGGSAAASLGDNKQSGGNGANGNNGTSTGGGGGEAANSAAAGNNGSGSLGGTGGAGADGGAGGLTGIEGVNGVAPGGGGGGSGAAAGVGGDGGAARVTITYDIELPDEDYELGFYCVNFDEHPKCFDLRREYPITVSLYFLRKDYDTPRFARSTEFVLGPYLIESQDLTPGIAGVNFDFSWDIFLGFYEIETIPTVPQFGLYFTLGFYNLADSYDQSSPYTFGVIAGDTNRTLGFYEVEHARFSHAVQVDRVFILGFYPIEYGTVLGNPFATIVNPVAAKVYIESTEADSQTLYGINGEFKVDPAIKSTDSDAQEIHLATAKIPMTTVFATFLLETPTPLQEGEFYYLTANHLLEVTNTVDFNLVVAIDPVPGADDEAIEITSQPGFHLPIFSWGNPG